MDDVETRVLNELGTDVRVSFRRIAKKLGVSPQTIINKYERLKENGTIQNVSIVIDINKIGYEGIATLLIKSSATNDAARTIEQLAKVENIILGTKTTGDFDAYAVLVFRNAKDLYEKVQEVQNLPNVNRVEVSFQVPSVPIPQPASKKTHALIEKYLKSQANTK